MDDRAEGAAPEAGPDPGGVVAFGPFRLDIAKRRLEEDGEPIALPARALDILVALVEQAGTTVSKNQLIARVWPGIAAHEGHLRAYIAALRKTLGGETGSRYLSTVSGQGYRFVAQVSRAGNTRPSPSRPALEQGYILPASPLRMVGRDHTVDEISEKLANRRFVTLVGPGGIGKTTVAVATGHALLTEFEGKVHLVDLGTIHHATLVPNFIASSLGLLGGSNDPSDGLVAFLRDRRMLLILDCCEPVIDTAAALAERLHKEAPQLHILATSRESLRVEGEYIHRLLPLESPPDETGLTAANALGFPAMELFVERASAGGGQFELNDTNARDVAEVCRRLDGIALAIELAASRVGTYGVKNTIELLNNQFNLLWEGRRTALPRHRTMHATIDWSYNLLSDVERATLCRLSVFFGNFTLEAARAVAAGEEIDDTAIMAAVASLVAKSMLAPSTGNTSARYRMLDTTRLFALEKLAATSDADMAARNHACYFLGLLEKIGDKSREDLFAVADQFGNIRAALTWCFTERGDLAIGIALAAASMPFFLELSLLAECQLWATRAIEALHQANGNVNHDLALHAALGYVRMLRGSTDSAKACLVRALQLAEKIDDVPNQLRLIDQLYLIQVFAGDLEDAVNIARRGEALAAGSKDFIALARMRVSLGISRHYAGDVSASRSYVEAALQQSQATEIDVCDRLTFDYPRRAEITMARILWLQGYPDQAIEMARKAIADLIAIDHPVKFCRAVLWGFAVFYWNSEAENYEEHIDRLLLEADRHSLVTLQIIGRAMKATVLLARGETAPGLVMLKGSVEKMHRHRFGPVTDCSTQLAGAMAMTGKSDEALDIIDRAIARAEHHRFMLEMPDVLRVKGEVLAYRKQPDFAQAEYSLRSSLDLARHQGALGYELRTGVSLARLWQRLGRREEAHDVLSSIYARFTEGFDSRPLTAARELLAELRSPPSGLVAIN